jgi:hypothetical protein
MTVLVDSDILIEVSRGKNADVVSKWIDLSHSDAAVLYSPVRSLNSKTAPVRMSTTL